MSLDFVLMVCVLFYRYINSLDPKISGQPWTYEEDKQLLQLVQKHGTGAVCCSCCVCYCCCSCFVFFFFCATLLMEVHEETSSYLLLGAQDQQLGAEQDQLPCGSSGTSSNNCQETETCMVWALSLIHI